MLAQIVALENPAIEQKEIEIVKKNASGKKYLLVIEDSIIKSLSYQKEIALKYYEMKNLLINYKRIKDLRLKQIKESKFPKLQKHKFDEIRESYRPVAFRSSLLFFCITDLANIDLMYNDLLNYLFYMSKLPNPLYLLKRHLKTQ